MAKKTTSTTTQEKRAAILKELEAVRKMLNEGKDTPEQKPAEVDTILESVREVRKEVQQEFQIPLLDPSRTTTFELDFSKPEQPDNKADLDQEPDPDSIPTIDDISASSSLFDDDDEADTDVPQRNLPDKQVIRAQAQLILQDLLNEAITEVEDKLDEWVPRLEIKLRKRLEQAIDSYIDEALKK